MARCDTIKRGLSDQSFAQILPYVTGSFQLVAFALLILAGVVKFLRRRDLKTTGYYALGHLGLGAMAIAGSQAACGAKNE